jgi:hypothetical protein
MSSDNPDLLPCLGSACCTCAAGDANEVLNSRAVAVMTRMSDKLMGRDYVVEGMAMPMESDGVHAQVCNE